MDKYSDLDELRRLRRDLHRRPERSGEEKATAVRLGSFLERCRPDEIVTALGGHGVAAVFRGKEEGPTVMLRAETDALPIAEPPLFPHASARKGVSHKCGHDGHMAILAGTARALGQRRPRKGRLILLFQPAEETGEGALRIASDKRFDSLRPDYIFALHNWPGYPRHTVVIREGGMFAASTGLSLELTGRTAHAMAPEEGISPAEALKTIHSGLSGLHHPDRDSDSFSLITTVGVRLGGEDYGVSPGKGFLYLTVRAYRDEVLEKLVEQIKKLAGEIALRESLEADFHQSDTFPSVINSGECARLVKKSASSCALPVHAPSRGVASSEDIGHLFRSSRRGGALFLLGSGEGAPPLHSREYDFDDELISSGRDMFLALAEELLGRAPSAPALMA